MRRHTALPLSYVLAAPPAPSAPTTYENPINSFAEREQARDDAAEAALIRRMQRALVVASAVDARGFPPQITGKLDASTVEAFNILYRQRGHDETLAPSGIRANLAQLVDELETKAVPTVAYSSKATVNQKGRSTIDGRRKVLPDAVVIGKYTCRKGVCVGNSIQAREDARQLQLLLNQFPTSVVKTPIHVDGKIGNLTAQGVRAAVEAAYRRQGKTPTFDELAKVTPESVAAKIEDLLTKLAQERIFQEKQAQVAAEAAKVIPPKTPTLNYQKLPNGTIVGDKAFRCYVMSLQAQLNRLGQRLVVDGVVGRNTALSVNAVLRLSDKDAMVPLGVGQALPGLILEVQRAADAKSAPKVAAETTKLIAVKCALENTQPAVDARHVPSAAAPTAGAKPTATASVVAPAVAAPTKPPTPKPTPVAAQPAPRVVAAATVAPPLAPKSASKSGKHAAGSATSAKAGRGVAGKGKRDRGSGSVAPTPAAVSAAATAQPAVGEPSEEEVRSIIATAIDRGVSQAAVEQLLTQAEAQQATPSQVVSALQSMVLAVERGEPATPPDAIVEPIVKPGVVPPTSAPSAPIVSPAVAQAEAEAGRHPTSSKARWGLVGGIALGLLGLGVAVGMQRGSSTSR